MRPGHSPSARAPPAGPSRCLARSRRSPAPSPRGGGAPRRIRAPPAPRALGRLAILGVAGNGKGRRTGPALPRQRLPAPGGSGPGPSGAGGAGAWVLRAPGWGAGARRSSFSRSPGLSVLVRGDGSAETGRLRVRKGRRPPPPLFPWGCGGPGPRPRRWRPCCPLRGGLAASWRRRGPLKPGIREGGAGTRREEAPRLAGPPPLVACRLFRWEHTAWEPVAMLL